MLNAPKTDLATRLRRLLIWLAAGWGFASLAHLVHADWLLPVAVLVLTAAVIRGGHSLLDRLMVALLLLLGAGITAGLLFTVWPWGLAPVPLAGTAISVLGLISVFGQRDLRLPRPTLADGAVAGGALLVAGYFARPFLRTDDMGRFALLMTGEDNSRHFGSFDGIGRVGGYLFWQSPGAMPNVDPGMESYPQGFHFTAALVDGFLRPASAHVDAATIVNHYVGFAIATYGLLALTVLWGARWIAGPLVSSWRVVPMVAVLTGVLCFGEFPTMLIHGFVSEIFGLALMAGLIAFVARRAGTVKEQVALLSVLLVAVGFSYQLFLPSAGLAVAGWLVINRQSVRPLLPFAAILAVAAAVSALPTVVAFGVSNIERAAVADGSIHSSSKTQLLALAAFVIALLLTPTARRLRVWRSYAMGLLAVGFLPVAIKTYLSLRSAPAMYYYEKSLTVTSVVLLLGIGAAALLLPPPRRRPTLPARPAGGWRQGTTTVVARASVPATALLLAVSAGAALGLAGPDTPYRPTAVGWSTSASRFWSREAATAYRPMATAVVHMARQAPVEAGVVNIVLGQDRALSYWETSYLSIYQRVQRSADSTLRVAVLRQGPAEVGAVVIANHQRLRIIALDEVGVRFAEQVRARYPGLVVDIQTWSASTS